MDPITDESYLSEYWSPLRQTIDTMLNHPPGSYQPVSYEQMYSAVYKCVCKSYSERLFQDLMGHIGQTLSQWAAEILSCSDATLPGRFHTAMTQYFHAVQSINPIFTYLNRFYIESKLSTTLAHELNCLFVNIVCEETIDRLLGILDRAQHIPFSIPPSVMQSTLKQLHALHPSYVNKNPDLFSKYLAGIQPAMNEADLEAQIKADRLLQVGSS